jgi:uncharacterized glyoxalase superfamily protein PhnB
MTKPISDGVAAIEFYKRAFGAQESARLKDIFSC